MKRPPTQLLQQPQRTGALFGTALIVSALLVGCSATTTMHYDLNAAKPSETPLASAGDSGGDVTSYRLLSLTVPEPLDVMTLMVRQPDNNLMVLSHDKWVAPLSQVTRQAMVNVLTHELGVPPLPENMNAGVNPADVIDVVIDVQQFDMQPAKQTTLSALWQVQVKQPKSMTITCYTTLSEPVVRGVAALVAAQQANVQRLGQQIAYTINTRTPAPGARCQ